MTRTQKQRARQDRAADTTATPEAGGADLRNPELDEDTACCLADIDCCLADNEAAAPERTAEELAAIEYAAARQEIADAEDAAQRALLVEQYASLGFRNQCICCTCGAWGFGPDGNGEPDFLGDA